MALEALFPSERWHGACALGSVATSIADIGDVRVHGFVRKWEDDFVLDVRSPAR
jgi:hypothetical protein